MEVLAISVKFLIFLSISTNAKEVLHLGVHTDLEGFLPAMELALETVNEDETFPFTFNATLDRSRCQPSVAIRNLVGRVFSSSTENQIMLIGADCSVSTEPIAELAPSWNLIQISPGSSSPRLSNTQTFPNFIRTVSSDAEIGIGIIQAMKQFGWSRIALITQSEDIFTFIATRVKEELAASNLMLLKEFTFNTEENVIEVVELLRNSPARIVFLNMYAEHALRVLCKAYKDHMYHPTYAWMFFNWYEDDWWLANSSCTSDGSVNRGSIERVLETSLVFDHYPRIEDERKDELNQAKITWNQYVKGYEMAVEENNDTQLYIDFGAHMFDAIWTAALALNNTESRLVKKNLTLKNFTYEDKHSISDIIYEEALKVEFFGLTGNVAFLENGDRPGRVRLLQYRRVYADDDDNLEKVQFARIVNGRLVYDSGESDSTVFKDGIAQDEEYFYIALPLFVIYTILSISGIIFATACLIFNLWFRNHKLVKLGSTYVSIMIIAGAVVFYTMVILFGVDENVASHTTVDGLCHAKVWLASIGFSLLYGTILAKTWRVYYIFSYTKPNSKLVVKDLYLFGIVGVLIIADIIFLMPPTLISSARLRREQEEFEGNNPSDLPAIVGVCTSDSSLTWLSFLFAYKGLILLAGLFLAFATRKVKIKPLNDSRFIAMSVYGAVIVSVALTPIGFLLQRYPSIQYGMIGIMILLSTSLILGLVFVIKMYRVYQDPLGISVEQSNSTVITNKSSASSETEAYKKTIEDLNKEVKALHDNLKMLKSGQADSNTMLPSKNILDRNETMLQDAVP